MSSAPSTTGARPDAVGFLTDTTLCIGCKACEVACKNWNKLEMDALQFTGFSYDNTVDLGAATWRHVAFVEQPIEQGPAGRVAWLMMSDVCKHCVNAACMEACPTGARVFGNLLDPKSEIRWVLENKRVFVLKEELGTKPSFFYFFDK